MCVCVKCVSWTASSMLCVKLSTCVVSAPQLTSHMCVCVRVSSKKISSEKSLFLRGYRCKRRCSQPSPLFAVVTLTLTKALCACVRVCVYELYTATFSRHKLTKAEGLICCWSVDACEKLYQLSTRSCPQLCLCACVLPSVS